MSEPIHGRNEVSHDTTAGHCPCGTRTRTTVRCADRTTATLDDRSGDGERGLARGAGLRRARASAGPVRVRPEDGEELDRAALAASRRVLLPDACGPGGSSCARLNSYSLTLLLHAEDQPIIGQRQVIDLIEIDPEGVEVPAELDQLRPVLGPADRSEFPAARSCLLYDAARSPGQPVRPRPVAPRLRRPCCRCLRVGAPRQWAGSGAEGLEGRGIDARDRELRGGKTAGDVIL
jgi:hypothetical protein